MLFGAAVDGLRDQRKRFAEPGIKAIVFGEERPGLVSEAPGQL